jgi:hypothetical protein
MGLDLSYKSLIEATAIDVTAHQSHTGEAASVAVVGGNRFGRAMAIIKRSDPGNSFLLYKLLINAQNFDAAELSGALGDEITRLRAGAIAGIPMPAAIAADAAPLSQTELQLISDWIAHGAVTSCEP